MARCHRRAIHKTIVDIFISPTLDILTAFRRIGTRGINPDAPHLTLLQVVSRKESEAPDTYS